MKKITLRRARLGRLSVILPLMLAAPMGLTTAACAQPAPSYQDESTFEGYLQAVGQRARAQGVSDRAVQSVLSGLTYNPRVVELDRAQPGSSTGSIPAFAPYRRKHVDAARIGGGRREYADQSGYLAGIERQYGVPGSIIIAIFGHETGYGANAGNFDLPRSLASLAFEGRRRPLFEGELIAVMKMVDRGVPRERLIGSWAGAFGYPQFLPSVYLRQARDGDGDGVANIWNNHADTLASIAHYFESAGWRRGVPWGVAVNVPAGLNRGALTSPTTSPRCPRVHERHTGWKTMAEWRALGIQPQNGVWPDDNVMASLLEPDGQGQTAYLLTGNYRVILDYNCSNFYALSVGLLADEIRR